MSKVQLNWQKTTKHVPVSQLKGKREIKKEKEKEKDKEKEREREEGRKKEGRVEQKTRPCNQKVFICIFRDAHWHRYRIKDKYKCIT